MPGKVLKDYFMFLHNAQFYCALQQKSGADPEFIYKSAYA